MIIADDITLPVSLREQSKKIQNLMVRLLSNSNENETVQLMQKDVLEESDLLAKELHAYQEKSVGGSFKDIINIEDIEKLIIDYTGHHPSDYSKALLLNKEYNQWASKNIIKYSFQKPVQVAVSFYTSVFLDEQGQIVVAGVHPAINDETDNYRPESWEMMPPSYLKTPPSRLEAGEQFIQVGVGHPFIAGLTTHGKLFFWGEFLGKRGINPHLKTEVFSELPRNDDTGLPPIDELGIKGISAGINQLFIWGRNLLDNKLRLFVYGINDYGQCGIPFEESLKKFKEVPLHDCFQDILKIDVNEDHSVFVIKDSHNGSLRYVTSQECPAEDYTLPEYLTNNIRHAPHGGSYYLKSVHLGTPLVTGGGFHVFWLYDGILKHRIINPNQVEKVYHPTGEVKKIASTYRNTYILLQNDGCSYNQIYVTHDNSNTLIEIEALKGTTDLYAHDYMAFFILNDGRVKAIRHQLFPGSLIPVQDQLVDVTIEPLKHRFINEKPRLQLSFFERVGLVEPRHGLFYRLNKAITQEQTNSPQNNQRVCSIQ
ncbi:MAG: hypothetical protein ACON5A_01280 [Candidatus Comchoanobacterales bacterium]